MLIHRLWTRNHDFGRTALVAVVTGMANGLEMVHDHNPLHREKPLAPHCREEPDAVFLGRPVAVYLRHAGAPRYRRGHGSGPVCRDRPLQLELQLGSEPSRRQHQHPSAAPPPRPSSLDWGPRLALLALMQFGPTGISVPVQVLRWARRCPAGAPFARRLAPLGPA